MDGNDIAEFSYDALGQRIEKYDAVADDEFAKVGFGQTYPIEIDWTDRKAKWKWNYVGIPERVSGWPNIYSR